jgi:hypothetical protein
VVARIDSLHLMRLYRSLSLEQLLELGTLWGRIDRWGRQWSDDNADLYKDPKSICAPKCARCRWVVRM